MLEQFKGFIAYTDEEFKELWEKAIFVVDTNILINFYKYTSKESTKSLLDILKKLKDTNRLWIPHQVALEYFFNYEDNMFKQNEGYDLLGKELKKLKEDAEKALSTVKSKHPYIMTDKFQFFIEDMKQSNQKLQEQLEKEIETLPDSKKTQKDLLDLLDGIVGEPYSQKEIDKIEKVGKERYLYNIPPGFEDKDKKDKQGYRTYGDFRYQRLYGDLIVWFQIMDRAKKEDSPYPVILITEDRKEDWWEKDKGQIKRPHPQLIQEFLNITKQKFYMYRTDSFVRNAIEHLGVDVSEEQAQEVTNEIENIRKSEEKEETEKVLKLSGFRDKNSYYGNYKEVWNNEIIVNDILPYLPKDQLEVFKEKINQAFAIGLDQSDSNLIFDNTVQWALNVSVPQLEKEVAELTGSLALKDLKMAQDANIKLTDLPENSVEKAVILLKHIKKLQKDIELLEFLPF